MTIGGADRLYGDGGEDVLIGGAYGDAIDGGTADDLILGDAVQLFRRDVLPIRIAGGMTPNGDITNPRLQALSGTQIYSTADANLGQALLQTPTIARNARDG